MLSDAFVRIEPKESEAVLSEIAPHLRDTRIDAAQAIVLAYDLPFYPGYRLLDIAGGPSVMAVKRYVVYKPGAVTVLNWTNEPIYRLNREAPITLTSNNVTDYARFFLSYVHGRNGPLHIIEAVNDVQWREDPPLSARKAVGRMIQPMQVTGHDKIGNYDLFACLMFKDALMRVTIHVKFDGHLTIGNEDVLAEDMPVRDAVLGQ